MEHALEMGKRPRRRHAPLLHLTRFRGREAVSNGSSRLFFPATSDRVAINRIETAI